MKMSFVAAAVVAVAGLSMPAVAGTAYLTDGVGNFNGTVGIGGAFTVHSLTGNNGLSDGIGGANTFQTFCIERNETLRPFGNGNVYNTQIATSAVNGGIGGGNPDPLSERTAYLYSRFRIGASIGGYLVNGAATYTGLTAKDVTSALQLAIWRSEDETDSSYSGLSLSTAMTNAADAMYNAANTWASGNAGNFLGVSVLRLYFRDANGNNAGNTQDQLSFVPLPPAAYAGLGSLVGVLGFGAIRRRRLRAE